MKNTINKYAALGSVIAGVTTVAAMTLPAFALTSGLGASVTAGVNATTSVGGTSAGAGVGVNASLSTKVKDITNRADQEITRRLNALNALSTRVNAMVRLSDSEKASLSSAIQAQISAMNSLQAQISADAQANNTTTLKTDVQSITKSYRIFALILPQGSIEAAADRVLTITNIMTDLSAKFSTRISAAQSAGNNVTGAANALTDMNAKISDANTKTNAATSEIATLQPDNGDATVRASNTATLKDARSKIQAAQQDIVTARMDAETIIKALGGFKVSASASTTVTSSSTTNVQ